MKCIRFAFVVSGLLAFVLDGNAVPFRFDDASTEIQEFVVAEITNCLRGAQIALMHEPSHQEDKRHLPLITRALGRELGLHEKYCVEVLKGDVSVGGYRRCYLYETARRAQALPPLFDVFGLIAPPSSFCYFDEGTRSNPRAGKRVWVTGRMIWKYLPPYDPYQSYMDEFVHLMLLTPETQLDMARLKPNKWHPSEKTLTGILGLGYTNMVSRQAMQKLKVEAAFSNRVFRMNEGCDFQVDYQLPETLGLTWRGLEPKERHMERLKSIQAGNSVLMHLSAEEVSELVYLAYLVDGDDAKGYAAAVLRCPKILKPVSEIKTTFGKRLLQALTEGGMLAQGGSVAVQQPEITEATLMSFFDSIESTGTNVVFTFKKSGGRYLYAIGGQDPQISRYGEAVSVPCDSEFMVCDRHLSLSFIPMRNTQEAVSFRLAYKKDFRSMGTSVTTNIARLVSVPKPTAMAVRMTKGRCLYGLQLLPLASQDAGSK